MKEYWNVYFWNVRWGIFETKNIQSKEIASLRIRRIDFRENADHMACACQMANESASMNNEHWTPSDEHVKMFKSNKTSFPNNISSSECDGTELANNKSYFVVQLNLLPHAACALASCLLCVTVWFTYTIILFERKYSILMDKLIEWTNVACLASRRARTEKQNAEQIELFIYLFNIYGVYAIDAIRTGWCCICGKRKRIFCGD